MEKPRDIITLSKSEAPKDVSFSPAFLKNSVSIVSLCKQLYI
jgi:hypothetical protein